MMTIASIHSLFLNCTSVSTDTRKIEKDSLFIALKGDNFDANTFAKEAIEKGAKYVIIDNPNYTIDERTILVEDSLIALQELAKYHRTYLGIPIIALTGSNGKTTTKELIHAVLSKKYNTLATIGNLNNHIGVPLTLLRFSKETEIGIVEMGANHQKEIEFLCQIAQPDFGYVTNFGKAHLEGFGGVEGVIKGKSEMYDYLRNNEKTVFVNLDDTTQREKSSHINQFSFTLNETEKTAVYTFNQTKGRGQYGNAWEMFPNQNLAFSFCIRKDKINAPPILFNYHTALLFQDFFANQHLVHPPTHFVET